MVPRPCRLVLGLLVVVVVVSSNCGVNAKSMPGAANPTLAEAPAAGGNVRHNWRCEVCCAAPGVPSPRTSYANFAPKNAGSARIMSCATGKEGGWLDDSYGTASAEYCKQDCKHVSHVFQMSIKELRIGDLLVAPARNKNFVDKVFSNGDMSRVPAALYAYLGNEKVLLYDSKIKAVEAPLGLVMSHVKSAIVLRHLNVEEHTFSTEQFRMAVRAAATEERENSPVVVYKVANCMLRVDRRRYCGHLSQGWHSTNCKHQFTPIAFQEGGEATEIFVKSYIPSLYDMAGLELFASDELDVASGDAPTVPPPQDGESELLDIGQTEKNATEELASEFSERRLTNRIFYRGHLKIDRSLYVRPATDASATVDATSTAGNSSNGLGKDPEDEVDGNPAIKVGKDIGASLEPAPTPPSDANDEYLLGGYSLLDGDDGDEENGSGEGTDTGTNDASFLEAEED
jgi:hypothetical protein